MNYSEAQIYMESLERCKGNTQQDDISELFRRLGNPQRRIKSVYAADVKGAAAAFVASIFRCAGIKAGCFLPVEGRAYREQILVERRRIIKEAFCEGVALIKMVCEEMVQDGYACPDEKTALKALALWYFDREKCQVAVLEEGTDHSDTGLKIKEPDQASRIRYGLERQTFDYKDYKKLEISLSGKAQIYNAVLAIEMVESLRATGFAISDNAVYRGLKETLLPGYFEILHKKPFFVIDRADCSTSAGELADSIELYFEKKRIIYILGMLQNDEMDTVISRTVKHADMVLTVTPQYPQALHAYELAKEIATYQTNVTAVDSLEEAVEISFLLAGKDDVIVAFGTPVLQDRLREILKKSKNK